MQKAVSDSEAQVKEWLAGQGNAMVKLLAELVNTDSGSYDKAGVDAAGEVLKRFFASEGLPVETVPSLVSPYTPNCVKSWMMLFWTVRPETFTV